MFDVYRVSEYSQIKQAITKIFNCTLCVFSKGEVTAEIGECEKSLRIPPNKLPVFPVLFYSLQLDGNYLFYENVHIFNCLCNCFVEEKLLCKLPWKSFDLSVSLAVLNALAHVAQNGHCLH